MTYPAVLQFDYAEFIANFPEFSQVPQSTMQRYWSIATVYMSSNNYGNLVNQGRQHGLDLMAAHLAYIANLIAQGMTSMVIAGATIDKVNLTLKPPETKTNFIWWLATSPYGLQLSALLTVAASGGFYIGGSAPGNAFRKPDGGFWQ